MERLSGSRSDTELQTLLIGIDAACHRVLDPLFEQDALPNLQSIFESGTTGELQSQIPPWTPSAWPSIYTGVNPGKHGVFGFLSFDGYDWDVVTGADVRELTLWELLDHHDRTSVIVNVPVTDPPREIDGAVIPGYTAPEEPTCHPEGLLDEVRSEIGEYRVYAPRDWEPSASERDWYRTLVEMRGDAFRTLCDRYDPAFGFVQFQQTDTLLHENPGDWERLRGVYEAVDEQIGRIVDDCAPETVLVVSDHGIGPYDGWEFRVNERLRTEGFVERSRDEAKMPSWDSVQREWVAEENGGRSLTSRLLERSLAAAAKRGVTSQRIGRVLETVGLDELVLDHVPVDLVQAGTERVDFANSTAYVRSRIECGVRINLEGREPDGIVPRDQYEAVREEVIERLESVTTPDGEPVFEDVAPREQYFEGPYLDNGPDIVLVPAEFDQYLSAQLHREEFAETGPLWNHKRDGVIAAAGAGVDADGEIADADLLDVAPTVLSLFDLPPSDRMDGDVLPFASGTGEQAVVGRVDDRSYPDHSHADGRMGDEAVAARLSDLGYIE